MTNFKPPRTSPFANYISDVSTVPAVIPTTKPAFGGLSPQNAMTSADWAKVDLTIIKNHMKTFKN